MKYSTSEGKELVTLRKRKMKDGGYSLLLDYMIDGVRTRESLKLYLVPERNKIDKYQNQETMKVANALKAKRILQLQGVLTGVKHAQRRDMSLTDYLEQQQESYREQGKGSYALTLGKIRRWLLKYGHKATLRTLDKEFILGFCKFMKDGGLSDGTICMYFANLNTVLNNAIRGELADDNPIRRIEISKKPRKPDTQREYLTLDELKRLIGADCKNDNVKRAFLFACFTGLRLSDVESLNWEQIRKSGDGWQVEKRMIKTGRIIYAPLSANAISQLPDRREGKVFKLPWRDAIGDCLQRWVKSAGINKHITFHSSRHTYATLLLTYGANIYTVSALLGHASVNTTQIYAKIVDENKRRTVNLIPDIVVGKDRP